MDRINVEIGPEYPDLAETSPDATVIPLAARNLQPIVPLVAPDHAESHPQSWSAIEVELSPQAAATVFQQASRRDLSKTQYLRSLLRRALDDDLLGGGAALFALGLVL